MRCFWICALGAAAGLCQAVDNYTITDLGLMGGSFSMHMSGAGTSASCGIFDAGGSNHGFVWTPSGIQDVGTLGGSWSAAYGVMSVGHSVGQSETASGEQHAFYSNGSSIFDLAFLGSYSAGFGINNALQIVGQHTSGGINRGFLASTSALITDLGFGETNDAAMAINSTGRVVGFGETSGINHAWFYDGTFQDLGTLVVGGYSAARGISNNNFVTGYALGSAGQNNAFIWNGSTMSALTPLAGDLSSEGFAVNNFAQVVGFSMDSSFNQRGTIWDSGVGYDLNSLIVGPTGGLNVIEGRGINGVHGIYATARDASGAYHAVILNPTTVPEPTSLAAIGIGLGALFGRRRTRK